jgi:hypothetical protein
MKLPLLTPERREELLAHKQRAEFYEDLKSRYGKATAERYLRACSRPKPPRSTRRVKSIFDWEVG